MVVQKGDESHCKFRKKITQQTNKSWTKPNHFPVASSRGRSKIFRQLLEPSYVVCYPWIGDSGVSTWQTKSWVHPTWHNHHWSCFDRRVRTCTFLLHTAFEPCKVLESELLKKTLIYVPFMLHDTAAPAIKVAKVFFIEWVPSLAFQLATSHFLQQCQWQVDVVTCWQ